MPASSNLFIVAIVPTFRRPRYLENMLRSLSSIRLPLTVMVVDNADDAATKAVAEADFGPVRITRVVPSANLGCGGGLEYGERLALERYPQATHFWIMDDDTEVAPGALEQMLAAMEKEGAAAACPSALDDAGRIAWFPGLLDAGAFRVIKKRCSLDEYLAQAGSAPSPFSWATGVSLLVRKGALERAGFHRADFWIRGDDIEFSLRITYKGTGLFVPTAVVRHFPPAASQATEREKEYFMLRNHAYIALHLPHGRRILNKLPGAVGRFLLNFGLGSWLMALKALLNGTTGKLGPMIAAKKK